MNTDDPGRPVGDAVRFPNVYFDLISNSISTSSAGRPWNRHKSRTQRYGVP